MIPALLLWVAMGQQPEKITCAGSTDGHCIPIDPPITIRVPAFEHKPMVIAGDGVELKAQPNGDVIAQKSEPLKCDPRYEYNESYGVQNCHADPDHPNSNIVICAPIVSCKPLMHTVTEKEWAELMERLKKLEARPEIKFGKTGELTDCAKEPNHCITW